jgi:prophage regulatory protein
MDNTADFRFLRLRQIIGDPRAIPPIQPLIPVSKSTWWQGVKEGRFPEPIKLSARITVWRASEIHGWISQAGMGANHE